MGPCPPPEPAPHRDHSPLGHLGSGLNLAQRAALRSRDPSSGPHVQRGRAQHHALHFLSSQAAGQKRQELRVSARTLSTCSSQEGHGHVPRHQLDPRLSCLTKKTSFPSGKARRSSWPQAGSGPAPAATRGRALSPFPSHSACTGTKGCSGATPRTRQVSSNTRGTQGPGRHDLALSPARAGTGS